ncbi:MAG: c-type cytochrome biogenesis protein CcmI [Mesorhizobium sp.]|nr:c-type cytochrome biogenesis protein CcmI [Mesorhizobium sp.]MBN9244168.1 c-type cytochrome biogenesis protein CcmI [Mesorhizobium sp.]
MLFWIIAAALTLAASLAVLLPLAGGALRPAPASSPDMAVYRDQLAELDRDLGRGLIQPAEAEQARAEIGRRLLRADSAAGLKAARPEGGMLKFVSTAAVLAIPLVSWGLYGMLGSPDMPPQPLAERLAKSPADSSVDELVARAEAHLASDPSDGKGWDVLAPVYLRMQRFSDSATAYRNAIRLEGETAARQIGLGEALTNDSGGIVSAEALAAFEAALKLEPTSPKANFYLAMAAMQDGRIDDAKNGWQRMLASLPADSPWRSAVQEALAEVGRRQAAPAAGGNGPTQEDMAAAQAMSPQDRSAMIETMVAGLDEKLRRDPHDVEGWKRLIRSYVVLGRADQARDALSRGVAVFGAGSADGKTVAAFAASLGVTATE